MFRFRSRTIINLYSDSGHDFDLIYIQIVIYFHTYFPCHVRVMFRRPVQFVKYYLQISLVMHAEAVACSIREVLSADFACHACRSSDLFSSWSISCRFRLSCMPKQWPVQFVKYYLQISLVMHAGAVAFSVREYVSVDFACNSCRSSDLFQFVKYYLQISLVMHAGAVAFSVREYVSVDFACNSCRSSGLFSSWSISCRFHLSCMPEQWPFQFVKYVSVDFTCHACRSSGQFVKMYL